MQDHQIALNYNFFFVPLSTTPRILKLEANEYKVHSYMTQLFK